MPELGASSQRGCSTPGPPSIRARVKTASSRIVLLLNGDGYPEAIVGRRVIAHSGLRHLAVEGGCWRVFIRGSSVETHALTLDFPVWRRGR